MAVLFPRTVELVWLGLDRFHVMLSSAVQNRTLHWCDLCSRGSSLRLYIQIFLILIPVSHKLQLYTEWHTINATSEVYEPSTVSCILLLTQATVPIKGVLEEGVLIVTIHQSREVSMDLSSCIVVLCLNYHIQIHGHVNYVIICRLRSARKASTIENSE